MKRTKADALYAKRRRSVKRPKRSDAKSARRAAVLQRAVKEAK